MASAHDVAAYILKKLGPMTAMKLQKLVYYCQAWSLVWGNASVSGAAQVRVEDFQMSRYFLLNKWQSLRYPSATFLP